jgi:translation initiation factor 4G
LSHSKYYDSRCRFILRNLVDLRADKWVPRIKKEDPKTIKELHQEIEERNNPGYSYNKGPLSNSSSNNNNNNNFPQRNKVQEIFDKNKPFNKSDIDYKNRNRGGNNSPAKGRHLNQNQNNNSYSVLNTPEVRVDTANKSQKLQQQSNIKPKEQKKEETINYEERFGPIIEELLSSKELKEAVRCMVELKPPKNTANAFIEQCINTGLERKVDARELLNEFLVLVGRGGVYSPDEIIQGLSTFLEYFDDITVDSPSFPVDIAKTLGGLISEEIFSLHTLYKFSNIFSAPTGEKTLDYIFSTISDQKGQQGLSTMVKESKFEVKKILEGISDQKETEFLSKHKL